MAYTNEIQEGRQYSIQIVKPQGDVGRYVVTGGHFQD